MVKKTTKKPSEKEINSAQYIELNPVLEPMAKKADGVVLTMGDFSPPSMRDHRLVESIKNYAAIHNSDVVVFVEKRGLDEGYLNEDLRIQLARRAFGDVVYPEAIESIKKAVELLKGAYVKIIVVMPRKIDDDDENLDSDTVEYSDPYSYDSIADPILDGDYDDFKNQLSYKLRPEARDLFIQCEQIISGNSLVENIRPMSIAERLKRAQTMKRYAKRIEIARERAALRRASPEKIRERARKKALEIIRARIIKNKEYSSLSPTEKNAVDIRLMGIPASVMDRITRKLIPVVKKTEAERFYKTHHHNTTSLSPSSIGYKGHKVDGQSVVNQLFSLIESVEQHTHVAKARRDIQAERERDRIKHIRMIAAAKHADITRNASAKISTETHESFDLGRKTSERPRIAQALQEFTKIPELLYMSNGKKRNLASDILAQFSVKSISADQLIDMYNDIVRGKSFEYAYNNVDAVD